ncbi:transcriptional regulator [bacterium]|nr:transcriptional regulator [bacterium]
MIEEEIELKKLLEELITYSAEEEWLEFKLNNYNPEEIGQYISALSNSAVLNNKPKAYLVFGIDDDNHNIVGTIFDPKKTKKGNELLEPWLINRLSPKIDFVIKKIQYNDKNIVMVKIDAASNSPTTFLKTAYIRVSSYKKKLSEYPEKERKLWKNLSKIVFENDKALKNTNIDTVLKLLDYPNYFSLLEMNLPDNKEAILKKFIEEKLISKEKNGKYTILNLGAILFAKNLNNFDHLSRKAIRIIKYKGKNRIETIKEHQMSKGYAIGFEEIVNYVNDQLPSNEEIGQAFRREVRMFPEIAIRELIANALIHQDFSVTGASPSVEIFDDRIEINNPGKPIISTYRFIDHNPQSRNEKLAYFMRRINICEERGSGIDKVIHATELYQLPAPNFIEADSFLKVILYAYKPLNKMDKQDKIRACYQHCCLKIVSGDFMTNQSLRERFSIKESNYSVASRVIADTINSKLIKVYDPDNKSKRYTKYIPFWN